jgi:hypothetical protein
VRQASGCGRAGFLAGQVVCQARRYVWPGGLAGHVYWPARGLASQVIWQARGLARQVAWQTTGSGRPGGLLGQEFGTLVCTSGQRVPQDSGSLRPEYAAGERVCQACWCGWAWGQSGQGSSRPSVVASRRSGRPGCPSR